MPCWNKYSPYTSTVVVRERQGAKSVPLPRRSEEDSKQGYLASFFPLKTKQKVYIKKLTKQVLESWKLLEVISAQNRA